jgi:hypothetical protein
MSELIIKPGKYVEPEDIERLVGDAGESCEDADVLSDLCNSLADLVAYDTNGYVHVSVEDDEDGPVLAATAFACYVSANRADSSMEDFTDIIELSHRLSCRVVEDDIMEIEARFLLHLDTD